MNFLQLRGHFNFTVGYSPIEIGLYLVQIPLSVPDKVQKSHNMFVGTGAKTLDQLDEQLLIFSEIFQLAFQGKPTTIVVRLVYNAFSVTPNAIVTRNCSSALCTRSSISCCTQDMKKETMTTFHFRALQAVQAVDMFFRCLGGSAFGLRWKPGGAGANDLAVFGSDISVTVDARRIWILGRRKTFFKSSNNSLPPAKD